MENIKNLTPKKGAGWGCIGCGRQPSVTERDVNLCDRCGCRVFSQTAHTYYVDKWGGFVPDYAIDFKGEDYGHG